MLKKLNTWFIKKWIKLTGVTKENLSQKEAPSNLLQYQGIDDLPMYNFRKVLKTGDTRYLLIADNYRTLPNQIVKYEDWEDIFWEYIEEKGLSSEFKLRLELKAKLAILEYEQIFEGKKNQVKIDITKGKLENLKKDVSKVSETENDLILGKFIGYKIDLKNTTVKEYIGLEKLLSKANKQLEAQKQKDGSIKR